MQVDDFAWRVHDALQGWTASVDVKASIVVVVETAVTGAATHALVTHHGELHSAVGLHLATAIIALTALVLAVACALWVIFPRLERQRTRMLQSRGLIYFGHLHTQTPECIQAALAALTTEEVQRQLALQLQVTSAVAWRKHAWLQASLLLFALGAAVLVISFVAF